MDFMDDEIQCRCNRDMTDFIAAVRGARCAGKPFGCTRTVSRLLVSLEDPGQGFHVIAPLHFTACCRRHEKAVRRFASMSAVPWLGIGVISPDQLTEVLDWVHGDSGLCAYGRRAISVTTPGAGALP